MELHPDFSDLLAAFVTAEVRFALLGGYAVSFHGKPRATKDMDLPRTEEMPREPS